jgi:hypothetical protein
MSNPRSMTPENEIRLLFAHVGGGDVSEGVASTGIDISELIREVVELTRNWRLQTTRRLEYLEADVSKLKGSETEAPSWRGRRSHLVRGTHESVAEATWREVQELLGKLEDGVAEPPTLLYVFMELAVQLGLLEERAYNTNRTYEGRLAGSLRDICRIHDPNEVTEEQVSQLAACVRALLNGWGKLDRDKVRYIRSRLLEVGLTWLPVTDKAARDVEAAEREAAANG